MHQPAVRAEAGSDLTRKVGVASILADEAEVTQVIQPDPTVRRGYQNLVLAC